jgi:class 3 adenylate cyclase
VIETQPRPTIRTIVASFVFTDLVAFSKGTAADQYAAKAKLSAVLRRNLAPLRESDYWIKDTGDGALIAFVSNPEHALYMALALAEEYPATVESAPSSSLRTGLHLGTVKESVDVEARRNFIGDGINAAKRIMDFADPGQIAASRSFFEAIANLDAAYAALFHHLGAPDDKHGRAHELYALAPSSSVLERLRADIAAENPQATDATRGAGTEKAADAGAVSSAPSRFRRPAVVLALVAMIGTASIYAFTQLREPSPVPDRQPVDSPGASSVSPAASPKKEEGAPPAVTATTSPPAVSEPAVPAPGTASQAPVRAATPRNADAIDPARSAGVGGSATRSTPEVKPKPLPQPPTSATDANATRSSPRCSRIVEKAALGEPLTPEEQKELTNSCR